MGRRIERDHALLTALLVSVVGIAACSFGCAGEGPRAPADRPPEEMALEKTCGLALLRLEELIDLRSTDGAWPAADIAEAEALHSTGKELYLQREYELSLELVERGIALLQSARASP
jgi:hypothetical protein